MPVLTCYLPVKYETTNSIANMT